MATRQVVIEVPETILLAEMTDQVSFVREIRLLAAVKLYELGRLSSGSGTGGNVNGTNEPEVG